MQYHKSLAISVLTVLLMLLATYSAEAVQKPMLSFIQLDSVPSVLVVGDEVVFTGKLTDIDGNGLVGKSVNIGEERPTAFNVLSTAVTDGNGEFKTTWIADLDNPATDRIMSVSAAFPGDEQYQAAKSSRVGFRVAVQTMNVSITSDESIYYSGERATFTVKFSSQAGNPFDPEILVVFYDSTNVQLERKETGLYVYKTVPLTPPTHALQVIAEKHGYKVFRDSVTIDVLAPQLLPGVMVDLEWSPQPLLQGRAANFTLSFTDASSVVIPFVNYDFAIMKDKEVLLNLKEQETTNGMASHDYTFVDGGKYTAVVTVTGLGQAFDLLEVRQVFNFNIDVIKGSAFAVKVKALQKNEGLRVTFLNPELAPGAIYSITLRFSDPDVSLRTPTGWSVFTDGSIITLDTTDHPLEPGKKLFLRGLVRATDPISLDWSVIDFGGKIIKTGTSRVISLAFR